MPKLQIIIASTRPGRIGPTIAKWFYEYAVSEKSQFDIELVDLADFNLPVFDEPNLPVHKQYVNDHTKKWAESVESSDAFVFVTPEYDFGTPPSLLNALVYLSQEWSYKPVAFVSYGGISGGMRSVQMTKQVVNSLKMVPLYESVTIPNVEKLIDDSGTLVGTDIMKKSAVTMLDELLRWTIALRSMRK
jgi:NAD(P)H-dependent FMN reductase